VEHCGNFFKSTDLQGEIIYLSIRVDESKNMKNILMLKAQVYLENPERFRQTVPRYTPLHLNMKNPL
jgi:hypothetical protein